MTTTPPAVALRGVTKVYGTGAAASHALSDIDLTVGAGEFVALIGPSGCGSSTLPATVRHSSRPACWKAMP